MTEQELTEAYMKLRDENKRLREALEKILHTDCPLRENEWGYTSEAPECHNIVEMVLEATRKNW